MLEKFKALVLADSFNSAKPRNELIELIKAAQPEEVVNFITSKSSDEAKAPNVLPMLVALGEAAILTEVVNIGGFLTLNLNDKIHEMDSQSLVQICAKKMLDEHNELSSEAKANFNTIYQILLYGGVYSLFQDGAYNTVKKTEMALESAKAVAGYTTGLFGTFYNALPELPKVLDIRATVSGATNMIVNAACDLAGQDAMQKAGDLVQGTVGYTAYAFNAAYDALPQMKTRIVEPTYRSQLVTITDPDEDHESRDYTALINSLANADKKSMDLNLVLLNKIPAEKLQADYNQKSFIDDVVNNAGYNSNYQAVLDFIDHVLLKANMREEAQASLVARLAIKALKADNFELVDNLLVHYRAKNKGNHKFLKALNENAKLQKAFESYNKLHAKDIGEYMGAIQSDDTDVFQASIIRKELCLSKQALAYYVIPDTQQTLLHIFANKGKEYNEKVEAIIMCGVDINAKDHQKHTAFHYAVESRNVEAIKMMIYGASYGIFKDLGHNFGAKTEGTILKSVGEFFRDITDADLRRLTTEQLDLSTELDNVVDMAKWMTFEDLGFVMFYMLKRYPDKVVEIKDKLLAAAKENENPVPKGFVAKVYKFFTVKHADVKEGNMLSYMTSFTDQADASQAKLMEDIKSAEFLFNKLNQYSTQDESLPVPAHFSIITKKLEDDELSVEDAKTLYAQYTDTYCVGDNASFKQAMYDILDRRFTYQRFKMPVAKTPVQLLVWLAEQMYEESLERAAFIEAINKVGISQIKEPTLQNVGDTIVAKLCENKKDPHWQVFITNATKLWNGEELEKIVAVKDVPAVKAPKKEEVIKQPSSTSTGAKDGSGSVGDSTKKAAAKPITPTLQDGEKTKLLKTKPDWEKVVKPALESLKPRAVKSTSKFDKELTIKDLNIIYNDPKSLGEFIEKTKNNILLKANADKFLVEVARLASLQAEETKKTSSTPQAPTWTISAGVASICAVVSIGEALNRRFPLATLANYGLETQAPVATLLLFGTLTVPCSTYAYPLFGAFCGAASLAAHLYLEETKNPIIIGCYVATIAISGFAHICRNNTTPAAEGKTV